MISLTDRVRFRNTQITGTNHFGNKQSDHSIRKKVDYRVQKYDYVTILSYHDIDFKNTRLR